ncbi:MAG: spermidine synthase, partial [Verrucomicrobiota bacterium]
ATLPLLLHAQPHRALFLGLGTGITFAAASVQPGLEADGVELVQEIVEAMPWFEPFNAWPREKAFRVYVADARRFVRASTAKYDVIVADLFHPARDGAGFLYSLEHYQAIQARLAPAGLVCQWLPLYQLDAPMLRVIFGTFLEVFPDAAVFLLRFNVDTPVIGLVSGLPAGGFAPDYFAQRVTDPNLIEHLNAEQVRDGFHLLGCYVGGTDAIRRFCAGAPLNTDDHPRVVFGAPRSFVNSPRPGNLLLELLKTCSSDVRELVRGGSSFGSDYADALAAFVSARDAYLRGLVLESNGERGAALAAYLDSVRLSPRFNTGYAQCLSIAAQESKNNPQLARQMLESLIQLRPEWPVAEQLMKRLPLGQ